MGVSEQIIFPEINYDEIDAIRGLDITISTSANNADEGRALWKRSTFLLRNEKHWINARRARSTDSF